MKTYRGLLDINRNPMTLDESRPIFFIDIDGVLNPMPYERHWVGETKINGMYDPEIYNPKNWKWETLEPDPELYYVPNRKLSFDLDRWSEYDAAYRTSLVVQQPEKQFKKISVNISDEMIDEIKALSKDFDLQIVYLTYWRSEALRTLEKEINLGATAFLDWFVESDLGHRRKVHALTDLYEDAMMETPFIMADDEALSGLESHSKLWYDYEELPHYRKNKPLTERELEKQAEAKILNAIPRLLVKPDSRWGIERKDMAAMRSFLETL